ncbi:MAG: MerR family transcriptional regulator [Brevundimonas sp.]|nr:MAG: MerR family transcriptional regulator [Brevundimonas sp.]
MVRSQARKRLTIARLAESAGVGVETVRYYQRRGLMPVPGPDGSGAYRTYTADHLHTLRFIRRAQVAGFTLEEIRNLLSADPVKDRASILDMASRRLKALDAQQADLTKARRALDNLVYDCRTSAQAPCPIIAALAPAKASDPADGARFGTPD